MREVSFYRVTSSKYLLFLVILSECWSFLIQPCIFTFLPSHFTLRFSFYVLSTSTLPCSWTRWCFVSIHFLVHFIPIFLFFSHFLCFLDRLPYLFLSPSSSLCRHPAAGLARYHYVSLLALPWELSSFSFAFFFLLSFMISIGRSHLTAKGHNSFDLQLDDEQKKK